jgi:HTH-type transcriptional regulator, competence development regulator
MQGLTAGRHTALPRVSAGMLTPFGVELRKLRVENSKRIFDLADDLEVSSSSVSAWETGRREVPPEKIERIGQIFELTEAELDRLKKAAEISRRRVIIEADSPDARQLANALKKKINSLSPDKIRELLGYFRSSKLVRHDRRVRRRSVKDVAKVAQTLRGGIGVTIHERFDVVRFYDFELAKIFAEILRSDTIENIRFEIWDDEEMPVDAVGMSSMFPPHVVVSNSVYEDAARGGNRGAWIMAHELGHLFLLHGIDEVKPENMMRGPEYLADGDEPLTSIPFFTDAPSKIPFGCSAEVQADEFAAELLMPAAGCAGLRPASLSQRFGVSHRVAAKRLEILARTVERRH